MPANDIIILIVSRNISRKIGDNFNKFSLFFNNASTEHVFINKEDLVYSDFYKLADSANKMVAENKQAEETLKESEANLSSLINNQNESIWSIDKNYKYITFNTFLSKEYFKAFNIKLKKGTNAIEILTPELKAFWKLKYDKAMSGEKIAFEFSNKRGDKLFYYEVFLNPIISGDKVTGVSALSVDITEQKQAKEELKKHRDHLEELVKERTKELEEKNKDLEEKNKELEKFNDLFVSREFRIKELKDEIKRLKHEKR